MVNSIICFAKLILYVECNWISLAPTKTVINFRLRRISWLTERRSAGVSCKGHDRFLRQDILCLLSTRYSFPYRAEFYTIHSESILHVKKWSTDCNSDSNIWLYDFLVTYNNEEYPRSPVNQSNTDR